MCEDKTPRIYIACLEAYSKGVLHGAWLDCNQGIENIWKGIDEVLRTSPVLGAEDWAIHSYENWQGISIGEYESIERVAELAELLQVHGRAFAAYYNYYGSDASLAGFQECYEGKYESEEDFAYSIWYELGKLKLLETWGILDIYIDWEAVARDLFIDSYFSVETGYKEVYVFNRY
ncbi:antirestriction protein ArdA [Chroococcidiopsis sp. TS-821]|uniref:antirestriction protein ArdA n=1 Tax=Chroococcidiopsis sp. TS-821 TaxID=1378066 RepID=UPI000CEE2A5E|nr:antirestriction protein ArdA [Chroococcidiopsis sp. TS-821]PPS41932.1 hypothetical protein B1A85_15750 [Chroococcidiopsis sp. TS-821]